ncbi:protein-tyrosine phosphatase [Alteribacillus persepolensis]|uniref:Tyrosine-protein phosphatase n=1 Tax=Alteribacillus persepolensis TaxID=568899 RepID=A0A1G8B1M7_9BACI|nr:CpsB/CapC family capsule biosynthesis tyrosine phosphatase [Alteribacillus persepolensis]SDH27172.1 protein-tyrosine phosphatase [Alteribacillus persepolensis]
MIDLHSHILPAVDDGPATDEDSLALARAAVEKGIHTVAATPHHRNGAFVNRGDEIAVMVHDFNRMLAAENIPLTVVSGQENRVHSYLAEELQKGDAIPINHSRYVLIEFPSVEVPPYTQQLFFDLQTQGYIPVIVHPERNKTFVEKADVLYHLVKNGALTQVTAHCFSARADKRTKQFAEGLVTRHLAHIIASDAHNTHTRPFNIHEAYRVLEKDIGIEYVEMLKQNAADIVNNKQLRMESPEPLKKRKFLGLF